MDVTKIFSKAYQEQCNIPFTIKYARVYYFEPMILPVPFYDASGGPFNTVPVTCWLVICDEEGNCGQAPCNPEMKDKILPLFLTGEKLTYNEWYKKSIWAIRNCGWSGETMNELGRMDLALHDLMAKRAGLPLHRLLGATRDWAKVYASACGTSLTIKECEKELTGFLDLGYDTFKIKVGTDFGTRLEQDCEKVRIIREIIGHDKRLAVDVNQIFDAPKALDFIKRIEQYDIAWYEEPVQANNFRELAKLTEVSPVPIGMGENVKNYYMLEEYVYCGVGQLQPIPTNVIGMQDWMKARALAYETGIEFTSGGISQLTASYIASGREEDMVEFLTPVIKPLNAFMKKVPIEKEGKFFLDSEPGAALVPDLELMKRVNMITHVDYLHD